MLSFPLHNIRKTIDDKWDQIYYKETRTIPGSADNYIIDLIEVPDDGSVNPKPIINGFTETNNYPPLSGSYYVNYNTGHIGFNEDDAGKQIDIEYYAKGSLIEADDINFLYEKISEIEQMYTISDTQPQPISGYQWYNTDNNILYIYDQSRSKWISIEKNTIVFGKKGVTNNQYLYYYGGNIPSNLSGYRIQRNCCITSISAQFSDIGTGTFYIRKNNDTSNIISFDILNDYGNHDNQINTNFNEGDVIQCYFESSFNNIKDPIVILEFAWT